MAQLLLYLIIKKINVNIKIIIELENQVKIRKILLILETGLNYQIKKLLNISSLLRTYQKFLIFRI